MTKKLSSLLVSELTQITTKLSSLDSRKKTTQDDIEFHNFMKMILEENIEKIQIKLEQDKQTNKKVKFINLYA